MSFLLILVLLLLAITAWFAARLILAAHRKATRVTPTPSGEDQPTLLDSFESPQAPQDLPLPCQPPPPIPNHDACADPIDGVPFLPGEAAISCPCGVAYRPESLDWLALHCHGRCLQCDALIEAPQPTLA